MWRLIALLALAPACWSWSFPESLLEPGLDAAGLAGGTGEDAGVVGGIGAVEGGIGGSGGVPISAGCRNHADCASGLCTLDGACAPESQISHVAPACSPTATGARTNPVCTLAAGLSLGRPFLLVGPGTFGVSSFDSPRQVYGLPGATLTASKCDTLSITQGEVVLVGFTIAGNVVATGNGTKAVLVGNSIGPSACVGVHAKTGAGLVMRRNLVQGHTGGGAWVQGGGFDLSNNVIVNNGANNSDVGGVRLTAVAGARFVNNTVSDNRGRNRPQDPQGVDCEGSVTLTNSIVWGNTEKAQLNSDCKPSFSLVGLPGDQMPSATNINADPLFVGGPARAAASYRLKPGSPAVDKGTMVGLTDDFFGEPRTGAPDLGAIEFR